MKTFIKVSLVLQIILHSICNGQSQVALSGGLNYSNYIGKGEGDNYFKANKPGYQFEFAVNNTDFEWIIWGVQYWESQNIVGHSKVSVSFWSPYYTEIYFYQKNKTNPLFIFFGYEYMRMRFPVVDEPENQYNITLGGGWNIKLLNRLYLQLKIKPFLVLGNSIGQYFGLSAMANLHFGTNYK